MLGAEDVEQDHFQGDALEGGLVHLLLPLDQEVDDVEALFLGVEMGGSSVLLFELGRREGGGAVDLELEEAAVMLEELVEEVGELFAGRKDLVGKLEGVGEVLLVEGLVESEKDGARHQSERCGNFGCCDRMLRIADDLVEERFGVAQRALGEGSDEGKDIVFAGDAEVFSDPGELFLEGLEGDPPQIKSLAAADDGGEDFVGFGGGEEKFHMHWGLFQSFEEGVEGLFGQHVHFVDDVDLIFARRWRVSDRFVDLADVVDAAVGRAVDLEDVERSSGVDVETGWAGIARLEVWGGVAAVQGFGKDAGKGRLPRAAASAEEIGMRQAVVAQGVFQSRNNSVLAYDAGEGLGAVFARNDLVLIFHKN